MDPRESRKTLNMHGCLSGGDTSNLEHTGNNVNDWIDKMKIKTSDAIFHEMDSMQIPTVAWRKIYNWKNNQHSTGG
jgi:hypothetical protein